MGVGRAPLTAASITNLLQNLQNILLIPSEAIQSQRKQRLRLDNPILAFSETRLGIRHTLVRLHESLEELLSRSLAFWLWGLRDDPDFRGSRGCE